MAELALVFAMTVSWRRLAIGLAMTYTRRLKWLVGSCRVVRYRA